MQNNDIFFKNTIDSNAKVMLFYTYRHKNNAMHKRR